MDKCESHADVILLWGAGAEFGRAIGVTPIYARLMLHRGRIPVRRYRAVAEAAQRDGFPGITYALLVELAKASEPKGSQGEADGGTEGPDR